MRTLAGPTNDSNIDSNTTIFVESCSSLHELHDLLPASTLFKPSPATSALHVQDITVSVRSEAPSILSSAHTVVSGYCRQSTCVQTEGLTPEPCTTNPPCLPPSAIHTLRLQWLPLLLPVLLLLISIVVTVTVTSPSPTVIYYLIAYAATFAVSVLWLSFCHALQTVQLLSQIVAHMPAAFASTVGVPLSSDARVRYVQAGVYERCLEMLAQLRALEKHNKHEDPLAFIREVIAFKALDLKNGHCIVDPAGTILWCNEALTAYFGWEPGGLIGENVRVLMPAPYCGKHDALMRNYDRAKWSNIICNRRRVPLVDRVGIQSTALLGVEEYTDPEDADNCVFLGSLTFPDGAAHPEPATAIQQRLDEGETDVGRCCAALATHPDSILVVNTQGIIEWVNDSATLALHYDFGELPGRNVTCLMGEEHAKRHDGFLAAYQERSLASFLGAGRFESSVVGRSRELHAKTKCGDFVRVYLTVRRVDRPSRLARDCFFVGTLLVVQQATDSSAAVVRSQSMRTLRSAASVTLAPVGTLSALATRKCSLAALELAHLDQRDAHHLHRDLSVFYNIAASLAARFKGVLHQPVGDRLHVSFNVLLLNNAHRSNAGNLLHAACRQWRFNRQQSHARLLAVGASGTCVVGQFMTTGVMLSQLHDLCSVFLRTASDMSPDHPIIDSALYDDLQYAYICRPINILSILDVNGKPVSPETLYELQYLKAIDEDEWMYQIAQSEKQDDLIHWRNCWDAVVASGWPDYAAALQHLAQHLAAQPDDAVGWWLREALRARQAGKASMLHQEAGKLRYILRFRGDDAGGGKVTSPLSSQSRRPLR